MNQERNFNGTGGVPPEITPQSRKDVIGALYPPEEFPGDFSPAQYEESSPSAFPKYTSLSGGEDIRAILKDAVRRPYPSINISTPLENPLDPIK